MKRFWKNVAVAPVEGGWQVTLDGRAIRTQGGRPQVVASRALADLLASEWARQEDTIDPAGFAARDLVDHAIDIVAAAPGETVAKLLRYAEGDTLCYRADPDEPLWKRQQAVWEPILSAFEAREGIRMERVSGIVHRPQMPETLAALRARLEALHPIRLAALEVMTSLAASLSVGLSGIEPDADLDALWTAAELEELWQAEQWGSDWEAEDRRAKRRAAFVGAAEVARAV